ncbi:reverse transcriptase [Caerostris extrusa]|uniref:Reverse transcriptase n=1 Tax=Caerostris extrusa TaxID=172846 RepID=A0AAV4RT37_CAEEX|nr:reverse transcriptase [Caerostris extrusa]
MPLKQDPTCLDYSKQIVLVRLRSLWTRLSKDQEYLKLQRIYGGVRKTGSLETMNGISLNDMHYNGGMIQDDLFTIMARFRTHVNALSADIKLIYLIILIDLSQHGQEIL